MALFGGRGGWGPNSPKYFPILLKFSPELVLKGTKQCIKNFLKNQIFIATGDTQNLHFWSNFDPILLPEDC